MKKIYLSLLVAAAAALTSCDMDLKPVGSLDESTAIQTIDDAAALRAGLYANLRGISTSAFFTDPEIQMDKFNGTIINGNRGGVIANGNILSNNSDINGFWASLYGVIANANFMIEKVQPLLDNAREQEEEVDALILEHFVGEARFVRAFCYAEMFDRFCTVYSEAKGDQPALGLPLVDKYYPTADRSKYPGRSTMNETLAFINADLDAALTASLDYEAALEEAENPSPLKPMAYYINSLVVKSMQARLALWVGDNAKAAALAKEVIESGKYVLATRTNYISMWTNDTNNEIIFMPFMSSPNELSNSIGGRWLSVYSDQADYIPAPNTLTMYGATTTEQNKDCRYTSFFGKRILNINGVDASATVFNKFPGNAALQATAGTVNLRNKAKVFRLSEMYLILAEASAANGDEATANSALNTLRTNRIKNYEEATYSGTTLVNQIRDERTKELIGEGFRMSDLRRWGLGFTRNGEGQTGIITPAGLLVVYTSDDYRYTWPIPSAEITSNPQLKGQQNPGY